MEKKDSGESVRVHSMLRFSIMLFALQTHKFDGSQWRQRLRLLHSLALRERHVNVAMERQFV